MGVCPPYDPLRQGNPDKGPDDRLDKATRRKLDKPNQTQISISAGILMTHDGTLASGPSYAERRPCTRTVDR